MTLYKKTILLIITTFIALICIFAAVSMILLNSFDQGEVSIECLVASLVFSGVVLCGVVLFFIRNTILKRLASLSSRVRLISEFSDIATRLEVKGDDELDELACSINSMLDSLEASEVALRESEERYRSLFEHAPDSIFILDTEGDAAGRIVAANRAAAEQHGYTQEELHCMRISDLNTPEANAVSGELFERILGGEWVTRELWHVRKDTSRFPLEIHAGLVKINGRSYILGFDRDITIRKLAEEADLKYLEQIRRLNTELAAANKELESFNYSVSHDMRGPLTRISGYCQLMLDGDVQLDPESHTYLTRIYEASCWLDEMIDAMLSISRLTNTEFVTESVDLSVVASEVLSDLKLTEKGRLVETRVSQGLMVEGDSRLLRIMMTNLLGNAWKYNACREQGHIEFGVLDDQPNPVYFVRDNGAGFDMQHADKLFRVFTRFHNASQFSGSGIGLATVQRIINRHGGRVWAEGEPDKGATFFFTLRRDDVGDSL